MHKRTLSHTILSLLESVGLSLIIDGSTCLGARYGEGEPKQTILFLLCLVLLKTNVRTDAQLLPSPPAAIIYRNPPPPAHTLTPLLFFVGLIRAKIFIPVFTIPRSPPHD